MLSSITISSSLQILAASNFNPLNGLYKEYLYVVPPVFESIFFKRTTIRESFNNPYAF